MSGFFDQGSRWIPQRVPPSPRRWRCRHCHTLNEAVKRACENCGRRRRTGGGSY